VHIPWQNLTVNVNDLRDNLDGPAEQLACVSLIPRVIRSDETPAAPTDETRRAFVLNWSDLNIQRDNIPFRIEIWRTIRPNIHLGLPRQVNGEWRFVLPDRQIRIPPDWFDLPEEKRLVPFEEVGGPPDVKPGIVRTVDLVYHPSSRTFSGEVNGSIGTKVTLLNDETSTVRMSFTIDAAGE
jgi:hypothetical protein